MESMKILAGLDIGNGYVKGLAHETKVSEKTKIDIPSAVAYVTAINDLKAKPEDVPGIVENIFNEADVSFDSPIIKDNNRRLFGERGIHSGMSVEEFDVFSHVSKANQDLSAILVLGCSAGLALQAYFRKNKSLPEETLKASMRIAVALPIREYMHHRAQYADKFKATTHMVSFHNFEKPVRIEISFEDVQVLAEGASAQFAIMAKGEPFVQALLDDVRKVDNTLPAEITASDVKNATTIVGIDIGEGTVNFPVFQNGKFNADASFSFDKGYGTVLSKTLDRLLDEGFPFNSRKELADYLQKQPSPMQRATYAKVERIRDEEKIAFVNEVKTQFKKSMGRIGAYIEVVYVYGGGAGHLKNELHPALVSIAKDFNAEYPILYLDSAYSRNLNREGLMYITDMVAGEAA